MKRIIFILSFILTGCLSGGDWQPYAILEPTATEPNNLTHSTMERVTTATPQGVCIVIADEALNLRAGAGTSYAVKDWLEAGDSLTLTGNQRGAWLEVITKDHVKGWVNSRYCKR